MSGDSPDSDERHSSSPDSHTDSSSREDTDVERVAAALNSAASPDRIEILLALWRDGPLPFADLQAAAGFEDSGRFNYHLNKLLDSFVEKAGDNYRLLGAGAKTIDVVLDARFGDSPAAIDASVAAECPNCDSGMVGRYENGTVEIVCVDCDTVVHMGYFPPRGRTSRSDEELFQAYAQRLWRDFTLAHRGVCPQCSGRTRTRIERDEDDEWHLQFPAATRCQDCEYSMRTAVGLLLFADPAVVSFLYDRGEHFEERPFWEYEFCIDDTAARIAETDPLRLVVPIRRDDETLRITVDERANVVETARVECR
jgi:hypothetical protein